MGDKIKKEIYSWGMVILVVLVLRAIFVEAYVIPTPSMEKTLLIGDALLVNRFIYGVKVPYTQIPLIPGRMPGRGEIIVFKYPFENRDFVKRCVAVGGDTVQIINKVVYINGKALSDSFIVCYDRSKNIKYYKRLERWSASKLSYTYYIDTLSFPGPSADHASYQKLWQEAKLADVYKVYIRDNFGPVVVPRDNVFAMGDNRDNSLDSRFWGPLHVKYLKGTPLFIYFSFDPGHEASSIFEILKFWTWKSIRLSRVGRVV